MSGFYPPGCSGTPFDDDDYCEVCAQLVDDCVCPECEVCGDVGDPACYRGHGLKRTELQKFLAEIADRRLAADLKAEYEWYKALMVCDCCGEREISDDDEIAAEQLCDRCFKEIQADNEVIGWGKGE